MRKSRSVYCSCVELETMDVSLQQPVSGTYAAARASSEARTSSKPTPTQDGIQRLQHEEQHGLFAQWAVSGVSVATATCVTNPIDVVKTRLQLQSATPMAGAQRLGMASMMSYVVRHEGVHALWKGLAPAMLRGMVYGGLRLGMYEPLKAAVVYTRWGGDGHATANFSDKVLAGTVSGGVAAALTSPTELIKTRMQAARGTQPISAVATVQQVVAQYGVTGLWRGCIPGVVRASMLTAAQCATYDTTKRWVMRSMGWSDHVGTQVTCALITGLVSTTITNPADVVKTKMFVGGSKGPLSAARGLVAAEGPAALMKGWLANYSRLGPQTLVTFLVAESVRKLVGLNSL